MPFVVLVILTLWAISLILGGLIFMLGTHTPGQPPRGVGIIRQASLRIAFKGRPFQARLRMTVAKEEVPEGRPLRVVLLLDGSGSMGGSRPGSRFRQACDAALAFVSRIRLENSLVGIVQYDDKVETLCGLTRSPDDLKQVLQVTKPHGGATDIGLGLERAWLELREERKRRPKTGSKAPWDVILLISDGAPYNSRGFLEPETLELAEEIKNDSIAIITVGVQGVNRDFMTSLASPDPETGRQHFYYLPNDDDLVSLYKSLADILAAACAERVTVRERVNVAAFTPDVDESAQKPRRVNLVSGRLEWFIPRLTPDELSCKYDLIPTRYGWHRIALEAAQMKWRDARQLEVEEHTAESNKSPHVLVVPYFAWWLLALLLNPFFWILRGWLTRRRKPAAILEWPRPVEIRPLDVDLPSLSWPEAREPVQFRPCLILGAGYSGKRILTYLRCLMRNLNNGDLPKEVYLRHIDTALAQYTRDVRFAGESLDADEAFVFGEDLNALVQEAQRNHPRYFSWFFRGRDRGFSREYQDVTSGAKRDRRLARLAFKTALEEDDSSLHHKLTHAMDSFLGAHLDDPAARIIVVGSTTGGSSGYLIDLLGAVRSLQSREKQIPVYLWLTGSTAVQSHGADRHVHHANCMAFVDELERLHATADLPQVRETRDGEVVEEFSRSLFDLATLVDIHKSEAGPGDAAATISDAIAWMIPRQSEMATYLADVVSGMNQATAGQAYVANIGCHSIRIPIATLRHHFRHRFLLDLLGRRLLLVETTSASFALAPDPEGSRLAFEGIFSQSESLPAELPPLFEAVAELTETGTSIPRHTWLGAFTELGCLKGVLETEAYLGRAQALCINRLVQWSLFTLNGSLRVGQEAGTAAAKRPGGLGRMIQGLESAIDRFQNLSRAVQQIEPSMFSVADRERITRHAAERLTLLAEVYAETTEDMLTEARRWSGALIDGFPPDTSAGRLSSFKGLIRRISRTLTESGRHLDELDEVTSVDFLADHEIRDAIYGRAYREVEEDTGVLARIEWRHDEEILGDAVTLAERGQRGSLKGILKLAIMAAEENEVTDPIAQQDTLLKLLCGLAAQMEAPDAMHLIWDEYLADKAAATHLNQLSLHPPEETPPPPHSCLAPDELSDSLNRQVKHTGTWAVPGCEGLGAAVIQVQAGIPMQSSASYGEAQKSTGNLESTAVFPEEQVAAILCDYYEETFDERCRPFMPRFRYLLRFAPRLVDFVNLLIAQQIKETTKEGARIIVVTVGGSDYTLTRPGDRPDYSAALRRFVIVGKDAADSRREIPAASVDASLFQKKQVTDAALNVLEDPDLLRDCQTLVRILAECGGELPLEGYQVTRRN